MGKRRSGWGLLLALALAPPLAAQDAGGWRHYPARPQAPAGAPNVLLIMTDDVGFGAASGFGGPVPTPVFDAIGEGGLRFNRFHTTAMCSPSRAALLTGRNHHAVGNGAIANLSRDLPGYTSVIPDSAATIADVLRGAGYVTAFLGKNHNTPEWETGAMGPFERWPTGLGFDYFYGFNAAWADQFAPELIENTTQIAPPGGPDYHLDRDLADHAIAWLRQRGNGAPDAPFFLYLAPGSPHTPHHAPEAWIAAQRGRFDAGWDTLREATFARQRAAGIIPADAVLTQRPPQLPAWDSLTPDEQRVAARMMEVFAAQLAHADFQIGRIIAELAATGQLANTLVIYIQGDNGGDLATLEGESNGFGAFFGEEPRLAAMLPELERLGGPQHWGGFPAAWGWATNSPLPWGKSMAGQLGGTRTGMAMAWPAGIARRGAVVDRFAHLVDIAPTIYAAAGITPPPHFAGVPQLPLDGASVADEFAADAPDPPREQYFEMLGSLGYYRDGWLASTAAHRPPWDRTSPRVPLPQEVADFDWQLFDLTRDFSQSRDLAAQEPERLAAMIAGFSGQAERNRVFPVEDNVLHLLAPGMRPAAPGAGPRFCYGGGGARIVAADVPALAGHWRITAEIELAGEGASGPLFVQGGRFTGWGLLLDAGRVRFVNRPSFVAARHGDVRATAALGPGRHTISAEIAPDPAAGRFAGRVQFRIDAEPAGGGMLPDTRILANPAWAGRFGLTPLLEDGTPVTCDCRVLEVQLELLGERP